MLAVFAIVISPIYKPSPDIPSKETPIIIVRPDGSGSSSGGGGEIPITNNPTNPNPNNPKQPTASITNIKLCANKDATKCQTDSYPKGVWLYWEVENGIGCCATYGCDYEKFKQCVSPEKFQLYELYLDGKYEIMDKRYNYTCAEVTPYNYNYYPSLEDGTHTIEINQLECGYGEIMKETIELIVMKDSISWKRLGV